MMMMMMIGYFYDVCDQGVVVILMMIMMTFMRRAWDEGGDGVCGAEPGDGGGRPRGFNQGTLQQSINQIFAQKFSPCNSQLFLIHVYTFLVT